MPARSQELKIGIGFRKQAGTGAAGTTPTQLQTALTADKLWNLGISAFNVPLPAFNKESDADFFGKGHEFVTAQFPTSINTSWDWPFHLTSQNAAQVFAFLLGKSTKSNPDVGAYQYVMTPMFPEADDVNLPATTVVAGIRQGSGGEIMDIAVIGMVCARASISLRRGPGLQNSQINSTWLGCGAYQNNSGLTIPARRNEERMGSGSASAVTVNGVNYIANARMVNIDWNFDNGIIDDSGFFPGSGDQDGFDIKGRMRYGKRTTGLAMQVELEAGSQELSDLLAGVIGPTTITIEGSLISGASSHLIELYFPETSHKAYKLGEADGFVTAQIETDIFYNATLGPVVVTVITDQDNVGQ